MRETSSQHNTTRRREKTVRRREKVYRALGRRMELQSPAPIGRAPTESHENRHCVWMRAAAHKMIERLQERLASMPTTLAHTLSQKFRGDPIASSPCAQEQSRTMRFEKAKLCMIRAIRIQQPCVSTRMSMKMLVAWIQRERERRSSEGGVRERGAGEVGWTDVTS
jgi:hypothetical protein